MPHHMIFLQASLAVSILARRCFHLELECSWLSEEDVNEAVHVSYRAYYYLYTIMIIHNNSEAPSTWQEDVPVYQIE